MRILHTSDWHVGRTFHGHDLLAEQESVLRGLAGLVVEESVDVVAVAGDLYDRAVPSADAVAVCTRVLREIRAAGAELVITSGNHDSAPRLGAFGSFAEAGGLHLRTSVAELARPVELADEHGPLLLFGIPYLEPETARFALGIPEQRGHTAVLTEAMDRVRAALPGGVRSVVLAHAFVTGGAPTESERTLAVGGVEQVPAAVFDGVDYVALGHLHGPQRITERVRYAGSPLAYSFSEARQRKSVWLVDFGADGVADIRRHELPVPRHLATMSGELPDLLSDEQYESYVDCFVSAELTDPVRPLDAMRKLRERFRYAVHLDWRPAGESPARRLHYAEAVRGAGDVELTERFLDDCRGAGASDAERTLLDTALAAVDAGEVQ